MSVTRKLSVSTLRDTIATLLPDINYKIPPDDFVVDTVDRAGANACPPVIVGVGVGGTFETAALLAKRAALRPLTDRNPRMGLPLDAASNRDP